jgi:alkylation response protein AidB-like acyl-CoA dehydrogenase
MSTQVRSESDEIRALAREYASTELRPHAEAWDAEGALPAEVVAQLRELGFCSMLADEADGGLGLGLATFCAAVEELAWGEPAAALAVVGHAAATVALSGLAGAEGDRRAVAGGELITAICWSDAATAVQQDDAGTATGVARWLGLATHAGAAVVPVCDGQDEAHVLVEVDAARVGATYATMGLRPFGLADVTLDRARVRVERVDGAAAEQSARLGLAATAVGMAQAALDHARDYAAVREQFGTALREFEGIQYKLADMRRRVLAARALVAEAARTADAALVLAAKVQGSETAMWVTTQAVQIFGGYGYMRDYPVEKLMRDARAVGVLLGDDDALRVILARTLYDGG